MRADLPVEMNLMRIVAQGLVPVTASGSPVEVVNRMGATQGQMTSNVPHSLISRTVDSTGSDVFSAFDSGRLVRSWPFRGTLHISTAEDYRWLRSLWNGHSWFNRAAQDVGLSDRHRDYARDVALEALAVEPQSRADLRASWISNGVGSELSEQDQARMIYILFVQFHQDGTFVSGPIRGNEHLILDTGLLAQDPTGWAELIDDGDPRARREAYAEIARRYAITHGPITVDDLARWTGAGKVTARQALADAVMISEQLSSEVSGSVSVATAPSSGLASGATTPPSVSGPSCTVEGSDGSGFVHEGTDSVVYPGYDPRPNSGVRLTTAYLDGNRLVEGLPSDPKAPIYYLRADLWDLTDQNRAEAKKTMYLAMFDELHVGYGDRSCLTDRAGEMLICPGGNGMFRPLVLDKGRLVAVNPKGLGLQWYKKPSKRLEMDTARAMNRVAKRLAK